MVQSILSGRLGPLNLLPATQPAPEKITPDTLPQLLEKMTEAGINWSQNQEIGQNILTLLTELPGFKEELVAGSGLRLKQPLPESTDNLTLNDFFEGEYPPTETQYELTWSNIFNFGVKAAEAVAPSTLSSFTDAITSAPDPLSVKKVMSDWGRKMAVDILLETTSKLTGLDKLVDVVPLIDLIKGVKKALSGEDKSLGEKLKALTYEFNNARASLKKRSDSMQFHVVDRLCLVLDILQKSVSLKNNEKSNLSELRKPVEEIHNSIGLGAVGKAVTFFLNVHDSWQQWEKSNITVNEFFINLTEKVAPEQMALPIRITEKIAQSIQDGKLQLEGLPDHPEVKVSGSEALQAKGAADVVAHIQWLKAVLIHPEMMKTLEKADDALLHETFGLDPAERAFLRNHLLRYAQALTSFKNNGSDAENIMAMMSQLEIAGANIALKPQLGAVGELLTDNARLSDIGELYTSKGTLAKMGKAFSMIDVQKTLQKAASAAFRTVFGVLGDAVKPLALVMQKTIQFSNSAYAVGVTQPGMLYSAFSDFLKQDFIDNRKDYANLSLDKIQALAVFCFTSRHVQVPVTATGGEWLKAYAEADPEKLTVKDKFIQHAVLEPMVVGEIIAAIRDDDPIRARRNLEPLSETLKIWAGESPGLRLAAETVPYLPALKRAWEELTALNHQELVGIRDALKAQRSLQEAINRNSLSKPSAETQEGRLKALGELQTKLVELQRKLGDEPSWKKGMQAELDALRNVLTRSLKGEALDRLQDELDSVQNHLKTVLQQPQADAISLRAIHEKLQLTLRNTLVAEGVPSSAIILEQLGALEKTLSTLPMEPKLTDIRSLQIFLGQAIARLATSDKPELQSAAAELNTLMRKFASENLVNFIDWAKDAFVNLFTKEIELTPEEKAQGYFVVESAPGRGQLAAGAAAGAAVGGLVSMLWLAGDSLLSKGDAARPMVINRRVPEALKTEGDHEPMIVTINAPDAGVYAPTTESIVGDSMQWKKLFCVLLATGAGAVSGLTIATLLNRPVREKRSEPVPVTSANETTSHSEAKIRNRRDLDSVKSETTRLTRSDLSMFFPGQLEESAGHRGRIRHSAKDEEIIKQILQSDNTTRNISVEDSHNIKGTTSSLTAGNVSNGWFYQDFREYRDERMQLDLLLARKRGVSVENKGTAKVNFSKQQVVEAGNVLSGQVKNGLVNRFCSELSFKTYIYQYIQEIIDKYPQSRGYITSPNDEVSIRPTGRSVHPERRVPIMDIATGKINMNDYDIVWEGHEQHKPLAARGSGVPKLAFRDALFPNGNNQQYSNTQNKARAAGTHGPALPDIIAKKHTDDLAKLKNNAEFKDSVKKYQNVAHVAVAEDIYTKLSKYSVKLTAEEKKDFKLLLNLFCEGAMDAFGLTFNGEPLANTVCFRYKNKILAWDDFGSSVMIDDSEAGRTNAEMQKFITSHLKAYTQAEMENSDVKNTRFKGSAFHAGSIIRSPFDTVTRDEHFSFNVSAAQAENDRDTMLRTKDERMKALIIDVTGSLVQAAITFFPIPPGASTLAKKALMRFTASVMTGLAKVNNADWPKDEHDLMEKAWRGALKNLIIDGVSIGSALAAKHYPDIISPLTTQTVQHMINTGVPSGTPRVPALIKFYLDKAATAKM
ncbi:hypothetical protein [Winslowiella iniecta]|uniref:Tox-PLDMTX domain-containing protein n=1 Tax=Winslowiella iniecta TaxID=1560201 RepID=A0A0L7TE54_9GAMM|nr:hypothetical protein [Winslowiella iniecta]KOC93640.1 hypothetical protein NG43_09130 [Winslowiella iniecta]